VTPLTVPFHHTLPTYHTSRFRIGRRLVGDFHASHFSFPFRTVLVKRRQTRVFRDDRGGLSVHALKAGQDGTAKVEHEEKRTGVLEIVFKESMTKKRNP